MMHILENYLAKFERALQQGDQKEALFQIHLMLQRDSVDQKGFINQSLEQYLKNFPDQTTETTCQETRDEYYELCEQIKNNFPSNELEKKFGDALQRFEDAPNVWSLKKIKFLAEQLIAKKLLEKAEYDILEESTASTRKEVPLKTPFEQNGSANHIRQPHQQLHSPSRQSGKEKNPQFEECKQRFEEQKQRFEEQKQRFEQQKNHVWEAGNHMREARNHMWEARNHMWEARNHMREAGKHVLESIKKRFR